MFIFENKIKTNLKILSSDEFRLQLKRLGLTKIFPDQAFKNKLINIQRLTTTAHSSSQE